MTLVYIKREKQKPYNNCFVKLWKKMDKPWGCVVYKSTRGSKQKSERSRGWLSHRLKSGMPSVAGGATRIIIIIIFSIRFSADAATHESRQQDESPNKCKWLCQLQEFLHFLCSCNSPLLFIITSLKNHPKALKKFHLNFRQK